MTETEVEAVARELFINDCGEPRDWGRWESIMDEYRDRARLAIAVLDKHRIERAGELQRFEPLDMGSDFTNPA